MIKKHHQTLKLIFVFLWIFTCLVTACGISPTAMNPTVLPVPTSTQNPIITKPVTSSEEQIKATQTEVGKLTFDPDIPVWAQKKFETKYLEFNDNVFIGFEETAYPIGNIQYFLVTAFETPLTSITVNEFNYIWSVKEIESEAWDGSFLISEESEKVLDHRWGAHQNGVTVISNTETELVSSLFDAESNHIAIIPAQFLVPELRTVRIDNESFFDPDGSLPKSIFSVPLYSSQPLTEEPITINFSFDQLTTVNITGVTALVRATAVLMRKNGNTYPAEKISSILLDADYTHISNEVSFSPFCPVQDYTNDGLVFCSPTSTFELLTYIDTDIVELTGDHLEDFGSDAFLYTLEVYKEAGFLTYGGGKNITTAMEPLKIEHNGNKFAFLGCNAKNQSYSRASENYPGTWHCDLEILKEAILELQIDGYTPIVTIQHLENELNTPPDALVSDFEELSSLTPIILIGTQAHLPKPMILDDDMFIHYGLGNLFFDQINESEAHEQALIDRLVFYNNELLSVELFPIKFIDYAQSRPMLPEEEQIFLSMLFSLSEFTHP